MKYALLSTATDEVLIQKEIETTQAAVESGKVIIQTNENRDVYPYAKTTGSLSSDCQFVFSTALGSIAVRLVRGGSDDSQGVSIAQKTVKSSMPGKVSRLLVSKNTLVEVGEPVLIIEAMKMENEIRAPISGTLDEVYVSSDQKIETGEKLFKIKKL